MVQWLQGQEAIINHQVGVIITFITQHMHEPAAAEIRALSSADPGNAGGQCTARFIGCCTPSTSLQAQVSNSSSMNENMLQHKLYKRSHVSLFDGSGQECEAANACGQQHCHSQPQASPEALQRHTRQRAVQLLLDAAQTLRAPETQQRKTCIGSKCVASAWWSLVFYAAPLPSASPTSAAAQRASPNSIR
jgi:hypothetical protein